jgi:hypothetical protein
MWYPEMNTASQRKINFTMEDALMIAVFWGGAWALGFLLGYG